MTPSPSQPIVLIPLDGRPICFDFPLLLARMAGIAVQCPPKGLLGQLKQPADWTALRQFISQAVATGQGVIASLDMLAYGGLIPSRVSDETLADLHARATEALALLQGKPVQGFSAILRIPHYNNAEEEPDYWAEHGLALAHYSAAVHQYPDTPPPVHIPAWVMADFLARRQRHHGLNLYWLEQLAAHQLTCLTFCQDDTGAYGLNVQEAQALSDAITQKALSNSQAWVQTGADEVMQTLLCRQMMASLPQPPTVWIGPTSERGFTDLIARFDGVPLAQVVAQRLAACGAQRASSMAAADVVWVVHSPGEALQGDHCEGIVADSTTDQVAVALGAIAQAQALGKPVIIGDVAYANGGDPLLLEALLTQTHHPCQWLYGYGGWNTPGNALGSALAMGLLRYWAEQHGTFNPEAFAQALSLRLLDDGAYQAHVRGQLREAQAQQRNSALPSRKALSDRMVPWAQRIGHWLGWQPPQGWCFDFPCGRTFEIEISPHPFL
jgi:Protein of unknown function (DUF4127)